jgi:hypothetical protein
MRTTLTLDNDIAAAIVQLGRARDANLNDIINEMLRKGLSDLTALPEERVPYQTQVVELGRLRTPSIDHVSESLSFADGEAFK